MLSLLNINPEKGLLLRIPNAHLRKTNSIATQASGTEALITEALKMTLFT